MLISDQRQSTGFDASVIIGKEKLLTTARLIGQSGKDAYL
jgi:hypothetical protein